MKNFLFFIFLIVFISAKKLRTHNEQCGIVLHDYDNMPDNLYLRGDCKILVPYKPCEWEESVKLESDLEHDTHLITTEGCRCTIIVSGGGNLFERYSVEKESSLNLNELTFCKCNDQGCASKCDSKVADYIEHVSAICYGSHPSEEN